MIVTFLVNLLAPGHTQFDLSRSIAIPLVLAAVTMVVVLVSLRKAYGSGDGVGEAIGWRLESVGTDG